MNAICQDARNISDERPRIDYAGPGAGTPIKNTAAFNRRFREFQRQLMSAGIELDGPNSYEFKIEDGGKTFYAIRGAASI